MLKENSIKARFRGDSLPTAIKQSDESITNLSNLVAMEEHCGDVRYLVKSNSGVARLPVLVIRNGSVHLLFDLTHEAKS